MTIKYYGVPDIITIYNTVWGQPVGWNNIYMKDIPVSWTPQGEMTQTGAYLANTLNLQYAVLLSDSIPGFHGWTYHPNGPAMVGINNNQNNSFRVARTIVHELMAHLWGKHQHAGHPLPGWVYEEGWETRRTITAGSTTGDQVPDRATDLISYDAACWYNQNKGTAIDLGDSTLVVR